MVHFDLLSTPDAVTVQLEHGWVALDKGAASTWQGRDIVLRIEEQGPERHVVLGPAHVPIQRMQLRWRQDIATNMRYLGDHWERGYGDLEWRGLVAERVLPWYFLTFDGRFTHGYGVKTGAGALCFWQVDTVGVSLYLDVRCGGVGVELRQRELTAAIIISRAGTGEESPFEAAQAFCRLLCPDPVLPSAPVYGSNNWYYAYGRSSHQQILDDASLLAGVAPQIENRPYMIIDDGWQQCHSVDAAGGPWRQGNYLFPDMAALADGIQARDARPGIWLRPLLTVEKVPEPWILSGERFVNMTQGVVLDPSVPEALNFISQDIERLVGWGFELIKHDFSTYDLLGLWGFEMGVKLTNTAWSFADRTRTTAEIIRTFYRALTEAAGSALVLGCNTVGHLAAGIFPLQRTGDDTSGVQWERTRKMGVNTLAFRMPQHGAFFAVDADCVGITHKIPWILNRQWLDLVARSGTPLFVSVAPDAVGKEQEHALRAAFELAARPHPVAQPIDWLETTCPSLWLIDNEVIQYDWYGDDGLQLL